MKQNADVSSTQLPRMSGGEKGSRDLQRMLSWLRRNWTKVIAFLLIVFFVVEEFSLPSAYEISRLAIENPTSTALMRAREEQKAGKTWTISHRWIPLSKISPHVIHAVIVAEDGTFYEHEGFDWYEIQESIERNLNEGRIARGASTITQQLAKNLYFSLSRDPVRKLKEALVTFRLERALSKERILELYLNLIEWGDGVFGVEAAARKYFGKPASGLTREETARLAAVIPSPLKHTPNSDSRFVVYRSRIVLMRMEARGW